MKLFQFEFLLSQLFIIIIMDNKASKKHIALNSAFHLFFFSIYLMPAYFCKKMVICCANVGIIQVHPLRHVKGFSKALKYA